MNIIENVQSSSTRTFFYLCNLVSINYDDRLKRLGLEHFKHRRIIHD